MASLFKKSKDKIKSGESVVGKIIYIFLLFAPLFSILTTCFYVMFNKNAFESYYGENINETQYTEKNITQLNVNDNVYYVNTNQGIIQRTGNDLKISASNIKHNNEEVDADLLQFYAYPSNPSTAVYCVFKKNNEQVKSVTLTQGSTQTITFTLLGYNNDVNQVYIDGLKFYKITNNKYSYLDNAFDYSLYKVEQNNIFNWSKTTGVYQVLQTTCNGLGITNTFTPMLLAYWLIISIIYFIYDIALMLVWIMHRKIHELQESI